MVLDHLLQPLRIGVPYKTCNQAKRRPASQVLSVVPFQGVSSLGAGERVLPGRDLRLRSIPIHHPLAQGVVRTRQTLWALPLLYATRKGGMLSVLERFPLGIRQLQETQETQAVSQRLRKVLPVWRRRLRHRTRQQAPRDP